MLAEYIKKNAVAYGIGVVPPDEIDRINILEASMKAMHLALYEIMRKGVKFTNIIVDGNHFRPIIPIYDDDDDLIMSHECVPKADNIYLNVAAAS